MAQFIYNLIPPRQPFIGNATPGEIAVMQRHFSYLQTKLEEGSLIMAGRCSDATYGIAIIEAPDLAAAEAFQKADPAIAEGVMTSELHEFMIALNKYKSGG